MYETMKIDKLEEYRQKNSLEWQLAPIKSNKELTDLAELLADDYELKVDKVYAKAVGNGNTIQVDVPRVEDWDALEYKTIAFLQNNGFLWCKTDIIHDYMKLYPDKQLILMKANVMTSLPISAEDRKMVTIARASLLSKDKIDNQPDIFD